MSRVFVRDEQGSTAIRAGIPLGLLRRLVFTGGPSAGIS